MIIAINVFYIFPIMLNAFNDPLYYAQNYAGIKGGSLITGRDSIYSV